MSVELPKDAEGREIPLDTSKLFISDGTMVHVLRFEYLHHTHDAHDAWFVYIERTPGEHMTLHACDVHLTPPDSWGKLEEDLDRAISTPRPDNFDSMTCGYFNSAGKNCQECKKRNGFDSSYCNKVAWKNILSRIRRLRGEDE